MTDSMLFFDILTMEFIKHKLGKNRECGLCGEVPTIQELIDEQHYVHILLTAMLSDG